jgi:hypothetical protein
MFRSTRPEVFLLLLNRLTNTRRKMPRPVHLAEPGFDSSWNQIPNHHRPRKSFFMAIHLLSCQPMAIRSPITCILASLIPLIAFAGQNIVSADSLFAQQAATLQQRGWNLDQIFAELCRTALANADSNPKYRLDDQIRSVFGGLWIWMGRGGNGRLQGRHDWAFHFIGGGAFEGYWDTGRSAALTKERLDARDPGNRFDMDDMAATMLGARWVELATRSDPADARRWIELWATGRYTLSRSLPALRYGQMPQGELATAEQVAAIRRAVDESLTLPPRPAE